MVKERLRRMLKKKLSEKNMEDVIAGNPKKFLGEDGLKLIARQYRIGNYSFDMLFEDRHSAKLIASSLLDAQVDLNPIR